MNKINNNLEWRERMGIDEKKEKKISKVKRFQVNY